MKILGIESSGLTASVAVISEDIMMAEYTINYKKKHSEILLPILDEVVKMIELDLQELDAIAVSAGPGSFTGLRIGSSTAKGLGLAMKKPLISIPTLESLAYNLFGSHQIICPLMDAKRNQVYTALYEFWGDEIKIIGKQRAISLEEILEEVNELGREVIFLGDGADVYKERIKEKVAIPFSFAPPHLSKQRAGAVAALGQLYYKKGMIETAAEHKPEYLRLSQAERERMERENNGTKKQII